MDFDIEMEDAAGGYPGEAAPYEATHHPDDMPRDDTDDILGTDADIDTRDGQEPGEIDEAVQAIDAADVAAEAIVPNKVHLRGLDTLTPDDLKAYFAEHAGGSGGFDRVEWIDDSSANLIFGSESSAAAAVTALCAMPIADATLLPMGELLPAKPYTAKAKSAADMATTSGPGLQVRFAVTSDKKQAGAASRSRFYLLHPEYDPEERQNRRQNQRRDDRRGGSGRGRDRDYRSKYRSYREEDDRAADIRNNSFDVNLYDDDAPALAARTSQTSRSRTWSRSQSRSRSRSRSRRHDVSRRSQADRELFPGKSKELFPHKVGGEGSTEDGRTTPTIVATAASGGRNRGRGRNGRLRSRSASPLHDDDDDYDGRRADARAIASSEAALRNRDKARTLKDRLSTTKPASESGSLELFPRKTIGMAQMDLLGGRDGAAALTSRLSDRITRPSNGEISKVTANGDANGSGSTFNIRGISRQQPGGGVGLSIKGAATARELFPDKFGGEGGNGNGHGSSSGRNAGKEIFSDRLENRTRPRQRAEDLFR
ncbi:hypothetical protein CMQ_6496 [Grosmannia clavigera kw1407]|uniref:Nucleotide-binding, alpha-beta plait n=1 Tax=Grosmannia clavigera (strain kw1407 / UAMH 11150) TaxID=655863 RepID=F0XMC6_GROCL|nr:uncharacterized protein CMQ_6496 [Grosmannia clavigera kw1407]EFX01554.1 hypothetical protein CMQ_6496 [Grosmannia clavigera kw1407]